MVAIKRIVISALLLTAAACSTQANAEPPHPKEVKATAPGISLEAETAIGLTDLQRSIYDYLVWQQAEDERKFAEYLASLPPPSAPEPEPQQEYYAPTASGTGGCGGATNGADQYIQRETNGSADPVNQPNLQGSGAWGCFQIMPGTWAASCSDLGPLVGSDGPTQAACASRLPLSAWGG